MKFLSKTGTTTGTPGRLPEAETDVTDDKSISIGTNQKPHDPRRLAELFNDLVYVSRSHNEREEDRKAEEWLKKARLLILQKLEESTNEYLKTSQSSGLPKWALNPSSQLFVEIPCFSENLRKRETYEEMFSREIRKLLSDCGFQEDQNYQLSRCGYTSPACYEITIFFPYKIPSQLPVCERIDIFQVNGLSQFKEGILKDPGRSSSSLTLNSKSQ
ncbi:hypothetical protein H0H93_009950 [Arthromyces matolae]|nr:hypothetical protein H0H93_009950 [Arthromyces matolae]